MRDYQKGFETERLIVRKLTRQDIPVWVEFFLDTASYEFIGLDENKSPCDLSEEWMERQFKRYREGTYGLMALVEKESMKLIGQCGLITMNVKAEDELEVGYHIIEQFRGKGYATEATRAFVDYAFSNNLAKSVISVINKKNSVSMKVSEKIRLQREEEITCMNKPAYLYRICREEWDNIKKSEH